VGVVDEDGAAMGGVGHAAGDAALLTHAALSAPGRAKKQIPISKSAPFQGGLAAAFGLAALSSCPGGQRTVPSLADLLDARQVLASRPSAFGQD
jgi:hypothetical protein